MKNKNNIKIGLGIIAFISLCFLLFSIFKLQIASIYFPMRYHSEINCIQQNLFLLLNGSETEVQKICDTDFPIMDSNNLLNFRHLLRKIEINSMKVRFADKYTEKGVEKFFVVIYFEKDFEKNMSFQLQNISGTWLISSCALSDWFRS